MDNEVLRDRVSTYLDGAGIEVFVGPPKAFFRLMGQTYVYQTLTSAGIKDEGRLPPGGPAATPELAYQLFIEQLAHFTGSRPGAVFWRRLPEFTVQPNGFYVTARLVFIPENPDDEARP